MSLRLSQSQRTMTLPKRSRIDTEETPNWRAHPEGPQTTKYLAFPSSLTNRQIEESSTAYGTVVWGLSWCRIMPETALPWFSITMPLQLNSVDTRINRTMMLRWFGCYLHRNWSIFGGVIDVFGVGDIFGWGVAWCGALPGENEYHVLGWVM